MNGVRFYTFGRTSVPMFIPAYTLPNMLVLFAKRNTLMLYLYLFRMFLFLLLRRSAKPNYQNLESQILGQVDINAFNDLFGSGVFCRNRQLRASEKNTFGVFRIYRWFEKDCAFIRACTLVSSNTVIGDVLICTSTFFPRAKFDSYEQPCAAWCGSTSE